MYGLNCYYETPLKYICKLPEISFKAFTMDDRPWYEIDDAQDLDIATVLFSKGEDKLRLIEKKYGGYWRFPGYIDFCYLVNPYFPPKEMVEKLHDLSLTHKVYGIIEDMPNSDIITILVQPSTNHSTNIDIILRP